MRNKVLYSVLLLALSLSVSAQDRPYLCEVGLQGGCGYYVGEAAPHIFQDVQWAAGGHLRYKFDNRWSLKLNGMYQVIRGPYEDYREPDNAALVSYKTNNGLTEDSRWQSQVVNVDVTAEYNFLRFGMPGYDARIKPYTPYLFLGVGCAVYPGPYKGKFKSVAAYVPVGIGFKWQFVKWCALHVAWQHNICFTDDLENVWNNDMGTNLLGNTHEMNGANILNVDLTSQLTLGIVFAFAQRPKVCKLCDNENKRR